MPLSNLISPERVACNVDAQSKKRALEELSQLITHGQDKLSSTDVFNSLLARERLGGTGVGYGVAIPHGRASNTDHTIGAFIRLTSGVDFDSIDNQPVDLLFALLVPEESCEEHLETLAQLATMFNDTKLRDQLRQAESADDIHKLLLNWQQPH